MTDARQTAAKLAAQINEIVSARGSNYGAPEDNFANIANLWNAWLHARYKCLIALDSVDVGIMSSLIKVARLAQTPGHEDSALDGAIYMLLGFGCGVSDQEPGMSDFNFDGGLREMMTATTPEPVKAAEAQNVERESWATAFARKQFLKEKVEEEMKPNSVFVSGLSTFNESEASLLPEPEVGSVWLPHVDILNKPYLTSYVVVQFRNGETKFAHADTLNWSAELVNPKDRIVRFRPATEEEIEKAIAALDKQRIAAKLNGLSLVPYDAKRDANNFSLKTMYGTGYCPQEGYYIVFKLKDGIAISGPTSTVGLDWVEWTKNAAGVGVDSWRYATDAEVIAFEDGKSNV